MSGNKRESPEHFLQRLISTIPGIDAAALVSPEGVPIASALPAHWDEGQVGAISAVLHSLGQKAAQAWNNGGLEQVFLQGVNGYFLISRRGPDMILAISASKDVKLGLIFRSWEE